jgi:hypothetical protein
MGSRSRAKQPPVSVDQTVQQSRELYDTAIREWQIVQTGETEFIVFRRPPSTSPDSGQLAYQRVLSMEAAESFVRTELLREIVLHTIATCSS